MESSLRIGSEATHLSRKRYRVMAITKVIIISINSRVKVRDALKRAIPEC